MKTIPKFFKIFLAKTNYPIAKVAIYLLIAFSAFVLLGKLSEMFEMTRPYLTLFILCMGYLLLGVLHNWLLEQNEYSFLKALGVKAYYADIILFSAFCLSVFANVTNLLFFKSDLFFVFALSPFVLPFWIFLKKAIHGALAIPQRVLPSTNVEEIESTRALVNFGRTDTYIRWQFINQVHPAPNDQLPDKPWGVSVPMEKIYGQSLVNVFKAYVLYYNFNGKPQYPIDFKYQWNFYVKSWWGGRRYLQPENSLKENKLKLSTIWKTSAEGHAMRINQVLIYAERTAADTHHTLVTQNFSSGNLLQWSGILTITAFLIFFIGCLFAIKPPVVSDSISPRPHETTNNIVEPTTKKARVATMIVGRYRNANQIRIVKNSLKHDGYTIYQEEERYSGLTRIGIEYIYTDKKEMLRVLRKLKEDYDRNTPVIRDIALN